MGRLRTRQPLFPSATSGFSSLARRIAGVTCGFALCFRQHPRLHSQGCLRRLAGTLPFGCPCLLSRLSGRLLLRSSYRLLGHLGRRAPSLLGLLNWRLAAQLRKRLSLGADGGSPPILETRLLESSHPSVPAFCNVY
jgi:hypothetical protein